MHVALLVLILVVTSVATAPARARESQPCILKATEVFPHLTGLSVKQTRTRPVSAAVRSTWQGRSRPIIVDIDFVADGVSETYSFMCVLAQGVAFVPRTMN